MTSVMRDGRRVRVIPRYPRCSVAGCPDPIDRRGFCGRHYQRWWKHGSPDVVLNPFGQAREWFEEAMAIDTDEHQLWPFGQNEKGYGKLYHNGRTCKVHALACERLHGPRPPGMEAAHDCSFRLCIRHVSWKTHADNIRDKQRDGTEIRGSRRWNAKLNEEDIPRILHLAAAGWTAVELGERFGVVPGTIRPVLKGRTWRHLANVSAVVAP